MYPCVNPISFVRKKRWSTLTLTYISSTLIGQNEYWHVSARKCTRRTGEAVGNALTVVNVQMYAEKKQAQFVVDRAAAAHRPLSGVMATVLQVYTVY